MANLSNINNKFLVTTGGNVLIGQTSAVGSSIFQVTGTSTFAGEINVKNASTRFISLNYEDGINSIISHSGTSYGLESLNVRGDKIYFYTDYEAGVPKGDITLTLENSHNAKFEGNVGIGISPGATSLHIYKSDATALIQASNTSGIAQVQFFPRDASNVAHLQSIKGVDSNLTFLTGGNSGNSYVPTERMRIDSSGNTFIKKNLQIGEASNTSSASNNYIPLKINTTYSTTASPQWSLQGWVATTDGADPFAMTSGETTKNVYMGIIGAQYMNQNRFSIIQGGQERLTVNLTQTGSGAVSGNVGIGTSLPNSKLTVSGPSTAASNTASQAIVDIVGSSTAHLLMGTASASPYGAWINTDATGQPLVLQGPGGNVGIGTTTPDAKLHIYGSASLSEMYLGEDAAADKAGILKYTQGNGSGTGVVTLSHWGNNSLTEGLAIKYGGNVGIGTTSPGDAKLYVNGGTTLGGTNNTSIGSFNVYGDRKYPQATYFVKRNYKLTAGSSNALYSIARQWHDHANWGLGNINMIMWGIYYGHSNQNKADFSCRYGYGGGTADAQANFNPGGLPTPTWTAATQVSGNVHYRDLQITIPAYQQISFEIISPGLQQTYNVNNTAGNTVYLYPH